MFLVDDISNAAPDPVEDRMKYALGVILQQNSIGAGLKKFGKRAVAGITKELNLMHNMSVFCSDKKESLMPEDKTKAILSLVFLKEKQESINVQMCANGRKQKDNWTEQDSTSPRVTTKSIFITSVIEAKE